MKTIRLFDRDPYLVQFVATIASQEKMDDGRWKIILDKTAFYPEGGGQPYDVGTLSGVAVQAVYEEGSVIYHLTDEPLPEAKVEGVVDYERRFDHMQQHCGQHILSAAFLAVANIETLSFHLGRNESTIDIKTEQPSIELLTAIENQANQIIMENRHIESRLFTRNEVELHFLRKVPSDQEMIRMVHITDFDLSACCGTHPYRTGEVGLIKIIQSEKHRGATRISFVCGYRALRYFQEEHALLQDLTRKMKVNQGLASEKLSAILLELEQQKKLTRTYYQEVIQYEALRLKPKAMVRCEEQEMSLYLLKSTAKGVQELKDLAKTIIQEPNRIAIMIYQLKDSTGMQWIMAVSDSVPLSVKELIDQLITQFGGNGGGSRVFGQWSGEFGAPDEIEYLKSVWKLS